MRNRSFMPVLLANWRTYNLRAEANPELVRYRGAEVKRQLPYPIDRFADELDGFLELSLQFRGPLREYIAPDHLQVELQDDEVVPDLVVKVA